MSRSLPPLNDGLPDAAGRCARLFVTSRACSQSTYIGRAVFAGFTTPGSSRRVRVRGHPLLRRVPPTHPGPR